VLATYSRTLNIHYANMTVPGLRLASDPQDLPYLKQVYKQVGRWVGGPGQWAARR
jgi:hypothetical protein